MEEIVYHNFFKTTAELKEEAKEGLRGNKGKSLAINLVFWLSKLCFFAGITLLIIGLANLKTISFNLPLFLILSVVFLLISIFTYGPLKVSQCYHSINLVENTNPKFSDIIFGFKNKYFRNAFYGVSLVFIYLFNLILLIVPFVSKYISYQISGYILAESLDKSVSEALKESSKLSKGQKGKYAKLFASFIPEFILSLITALIFSLFIRPQFNAAVYCYYRDIKE